MGWILFIALLVIVGLFWHELNKGNDHMSILYRWTFGKLGTKAPVRPHKPA